MSDRVLHQVVKGSGKAADLLADVAIFAKTNGSEDKELNRKDKPQTALKNLLQSFAPADAANFDIWAAINTLKGWEGGKVAETDLQRSVDVKLKKLMCETYKIVVRGQNGELHLYLQNTTTKKLYMYLRQSLEAVSTGLVFVFDLIASSADRLDFNRELLKCVHKSIDMSNTCAEDLDDSLGLKLEYTMKWGRDELVHEQLNEVLNEGVLSMDF
jgi:hypothetical protein